MLIPGAYYKVLNSNHYNEGEKGNYFTDLSPDLTWISANTGDIVLATSEITITCSGVPQTISNLTAQKLQLKRVNKKHYSLT